MWEEGEWLLSNMLDINLSRQSIGYIYVDRSEEGWWDEMR